MKAGITIKLIGSKGGRESKNGKQKKYAMGNTAKVLLTTVIVLAILAAAVMVVPGVYAKGLDTVYPNVSLNGTDLSRMTIEQARNALVSAGYEKNADGVSATINFPNGERMTITGSDAGLSLDAAEAAEAAYNYGRDGSFMNNGFIFLRSLIGKAELTDKNIALLDEEYVQKTAAEYTKRFNDALLEASTTIEQDRIVIIKGAGGALADEKEVYELTVAALNRAIAENTGITADYTLKNASDGDIDLPALYNKINAEPISAQYDTETKTVTESVTGVSFDMEAARNLLNSAKNGEQIVIPLIFTEPEVTTDQLEALLFRDVLATTKTYIDGTSNRLNNVVVSAAAINGLVLNPGEVFSFNDTVGQRTAARGYMSAGAYVGGKTVQEIGGGICQTSSTLYDAVMYADLEVVARANHMFTIPYLPLGHDATINWGTIDFKFKNNTEYPIRIEIITEGRYITATLFGTKLDGNYVKYENVTVSSTPYKTVQREDESVAPGKTIVETSGHTGYVVDTYKLLYDEDNNLISRTHVHRSTYRSQDRLVLVPVGTLETPPEDDPNETPTETATTSPSESPSDSSSESPPESPSDSPDASSDTSPADSPSDNTPEPSAEPPESQE